MAAEHFQELADGYRVGEGERLEVDGGDSRPPEAEDRITRYEWDLNADGQYDFNSDAPRAVNANFPFFVESVNFCTAPVAEDAA